MKLQLVLIMVILLSGATRNLCAFKLQTEAHKNQSSLDTYNAQPVAETSGLQVPLQRSKRSSHLAICTFCCGCCRQKGCGFCCRS
ncbi:hepcidin [Varanus komodoensis]|uniref:hepcidin n=1 Tax=Varanus komodoensis TaxID=61221 RepID=UPI001CF7B702|nr:hepcidin [Varanus komodoensis]